MDLSSGKFTAHRMGTYFFTFTGVVNFPTTPATSRVALSIGLYSNGKRIALGYVEKGNNVVQFSPVTLQSTLTLQKGDQIWLQITAMSAGVYLFDSNYYYTHFTGWLLEEEIFSRWTKKPNNSLLCTFNACYNKWSKKILLCCCYAISLSKLFHC